MCLELCVGDTRPAPARAGFAKGIAHCCERLLKLACFDFRILDFLPWGAHEGKLLFIYRRVNQHMAACAEDENGAGEETPTPGVDLDEGGLFLCDPPWPLCLKSGS